MRCKLFFFLVYGWVCNLFAQTSASNLLIPNIVRGPYLQIGTANSMILKWRTDVNCDSKVWYGTSISTITNQITNASLLTDHEIKITNLNPSTFYYYMIGTSSTTLLTASAGQTFKTSPVIGTKGKYRFWAVGDAGTGNVTEKTGFLNYIGSNHIDGWLWLGDNAYNSGFDSEYQTSVFANNTYATELKKFVVWPAPGNHDYNNNIPFSPPPAYLDIFTLPTLGEAGGLSSGTEKYYSYNYGNIHFVVLDSYSVPRGVTDPMAVWLQNDLAANNAAWTIAYFHHPPYTKGTHDSDNPNFLDGELPEIRQNIIPILENNGVDVVINGHSHVYERSFLVDGYYGTSSQLSPSMIKNNTSGNYPSSCPYQKQTLINKAHKGTVYAVVGCSGQTGVTASGWPHPVMYSYNNILLGSMLVEVNDNRLDAKFITSNSAVYDGFTIVKNAGKKTTVNICQGQNAVLKPSWPEPVYWFPIGTTLDSAIVSPPFSTTYFAYDPNSCIKDTFVVNVTPNNVPPCNITALPNYDPALEVSVYPTMIRNKNEAFTIRTFSGAKIEHVKVLDIQGIAIDIYSNEQPMNELNIYFKNEPQNGTYFLELIIDNKMIHKKIIFNK
ncbi:MAG: metallophosphoesterase family protein [Bacteroidetes bacterium]|nr:metallophosphoesterase family protein [Bacteroidota bacterium]